MSTARQKNRGLGKKRCSTPLGDLAKELGVPKKRLLVLAAKNDPFNAGTAFDREMAEWFARIYREHGFAAGVHLRRIHYRLVSLPEPITIPGGKPYINTVECWKDLGVACKKARHLGLVDAAEFEDRRNPQPKIYAPDLVLPGEPEWHVDDFEGIFIPGIRTTLNVACETPDIYVDGYEYDSGQQPYRLEAWIEKSTIDEIDPVCRQYEANLVPALGVQSITSAIRMLERAKGWMEDDRPVRIWYISDFDPAGKCMPTAVARQLEFWMHQYGIKADVKLKPLVLTKAQVIAYKLPRSPIKESEMRKGKFEERYGEGATELDALEALHPGVLGELLEAELRPYRDETLEGRAASASYEASFVASEAWGDAMEGIRERLESLEADAREVLDRYQPKLIKLSEELEEELASIREEAELVEDDLKEEIATEADELDIDLPEYPKAEIDPPDESDWLFDSTRSFMEQTNIYRAHREGKFQA